MKATEEKFRTLNKHAVMSYSGEAGDAVHFAELIQRNIQLYGVRHEQQELGVEAAASWTRQVLADSLRSRSPYQVNLLIGGLENVREPRMVADKEGEVSECSASLWAPRLYWIDYLAAMVEVPFAVHGYASYFCTSLLDRHWREGMNETEVLDLLRLCLRELQKRFIVNFPDVSVRIIRASGVEAVDLA